MVQAARGGRKPAPVIRAARAQEACSRHFLQFYWQHAVPSSYNMLRSFTNGAGKNHWPGFVKNKGAGEDRKAETRAGRQRQDREVQKERNGQGRFQFYPSHGMEEEMEKRLEELYKQLADLIPDALAEDFVGMGYAKGRFYDSAEKRILVVEKIPRPGKAGCGCHKEGWEDEKDFANVVGLAVRQLLGEKMPWQDYIAWSYLYKLAPKTGKPDDTIYRKQKELCKEIMECELELLNPTHVLFLTGWGGIWDFGLPLTSLLKGEAVEAWGKTEDGKNLIVTRYAVRKPEESFALQIVERIKLLEELSQEVEE